MKPGEGARLSADGRRLLVSRAQISDAAHFRCVATNEAGETRRDFAVLVHGNAATLPLTSSLCHKIVWGCFLWKRRILVVM